MSPVLWNVSELFSSHSVSATSHHTSTNLTLMTQRRTTTIFKTLRTPASSTSPASSILLLPLFSQRGNLSDSLATKIVRNNDGQHNTKPLPKSKRLKMHLHIFVLMCFCRALCAVCFQFVRLPAVYHVSPSWNHRWFPRCKNTKQKKCTSSPISLLFASDYWCHLSLPLFIDCLRTNWMEGKTLHYHLGQCYCVCFGGGKVNWKH